MAQLCAGYLWPHSKDPRGLLVTFCLLEVAGDAAASFEVNTTNGDGNPVTVEMIQVRRENRSCVTIFYLDQNPMAETPPGDGNIEHLTLEHWAQLFWHAPSPQIVPEGSMPSPGAR